MSEYVREDVRYMSEYARHITVKIQNLLSSFVEEWLGYVEGESSGKCV